MKPVLPAALLAGACLAIPVSAQEADPGETMPCGEFVGLNIDDQQIAMGQVQSTPQIDPTAEESATAVVAACTDNPDLTLADAMKEALRE
jgi:hypothetical protein